MKIRLQRAMLIVLFLGLVPCGLLALLLLFGAVGCAIRDGFSYGVVFAVFFMAIGVALPVMALLLLRELNEGYGLKLRRLLFGFYLAVFIYCGLWAISLESLEFVALVCAVLLVPVLATMFMPVEAASTDPAPRSRRSR